MGTVPGAIGMSGSDTPGVSLRPWQPGDRCLLERLLGDPAMTEHLGGPESPERLAERHARYLHGGGRGAGAQFAILLGSQGEAAGWVGYWESEWRACPIWEIGWSVLPEHQGRGVATAAGALLLERVRHAGRHRYVHAFPALANAASNAVCRSLGMECLGSATIEYPPGHVMTSNNWRMDLRLA